MRNLFLLLLLSNVGIFAWQYYWPEKAVVKMSPLSASIEKIEMLQELPEIKSDEGKPVEQVLPQCFTLGPFPEKSAASGVKDVLEAGAGQIKWRSKQETRHHRYWVFMPSFKSRAEAIAMSKKLARKKVKDYYIVSSGKNNNAISLGHYKEKPHADRRLMLLNKLGFKPAIEPIYREYKLFWLDYEVPPGDRLDDALILGLLPAGVGQLKRSCH